MTSARRGRLLFFVGTDNLCPLSIFVPSHSLFLVVQEKYDLVGWACFVVSSIFYTIAAIEFDSLT